MAVSADLASDSRLRDLQSLMDSSLSRLGEQELLDELVARVRQVFGADTAAVLLLDTSASQLVATAAAGLEEEVRQGVRIPVGTGFAGRIAADRRAVVLNRVDETTVFNPILLDKGIRALLGVPLIAGGRLVGVLHVGSLTPRVFTRQEAELLQVAGDRAAAAVQSLASWEDQRAAAALQRGLLPAALPAFPGLEMAGRYITGTGNFGGDWYDVFQLPSGELGLVIGDVAGSGLAAAVVMERMRSALRAYSLQTDDPAEVLCRLDRKMHHFEPDAMATVLYGILSQDASSMRVSSAGHLPPVYAKPGEPAGFAPMTQDLLIGVDTQTHRHVQTVRIDPGSVFCCYTDGLIERPGEPLDAGFERLRRSVSASPAEAVTATVMRDLVGTDTPRDDIALLVLRRTEPS
ncbi:MAG TPA: GAF domain-containing SpoIIE family protein phosphatase [Streptosporangiaceae bacterium]|nr:GAF domain-containing SpoIIE family protein phosphatase [Streptosporangiaceae bacterium]